MQRATDSVVLHDLMVLAANESAPSQVRATASQKIDALAAWFNQPATQDESLTAFYRFAAAQIKRFQANPKEIGIPRPPDPPPGMPIGDDEPDYVVW